MHYYTDSDLSVKAVDAVRSRTMGDFSKRVGARIRELRRATGLTQEELAERLGNGCASVTVSRFERGALEPSFDWLERIATAVNTDIDGLLAGVVGRRVEPGELRPGVRQVIEALQELDDHQIIGARKVLRAHIDAVRSTR